MEDALQSITKFWEDFAPEQLPDLGPWTPAIIAGVIGLLYCFVGYRLFKFTLTLTGFLLGGGALGLLGAYLLPGQPLGLALGVLAGGGFGAIIMFTLFRAGVFLVGFLGALVAAYTFLYDRPESWAPWAILVCAVLGGGLGLFLERPVLSVATAILGGWILAVSVAIILETLGNQRPGMPADSPSWTPYLLLGIWVIFAFMGGLTQLRASRKRKILPV